MQHRNCKPNQLNKKQLFAFYTAIVLLLFIILNIVLNACLICCVYVFVIYLCIADQNAGTLLFYRIVSDFGATQAFVALALTPILLIATVILCYAFTRILCNLPLYALADNELLMYKSFLFRSIQHRSIPVSIGRFVFFNVQIDSIYHYFIQQLQFLSERQTPGASRPR